ncbi:MAG: DUF1501 domain-containing protein, partial [Kangiellaceae bacterium]|nr:DUF1501 domain-containing protein [Kangiellaceae bacterium]
MVKNRLNETSRSRGSSKAKFNRREFCKSLVKSNLAGSGIYGTLGSLSLANAATKESDFNDYKALVCVFLAGGNDSFNTLLARSTAEYNIYRQSRLSLAIEQQDILAINPLISDGVDYGFNPQLIDLQSLFNTGDLACLANVGTLISPTTRDQIFNNSAILPPQLFSHSDQQDFWRSLQLPSNERTGWAGRASDLLMDTQSPLPMNISLSGTDLWQRGANDSAYGISASGVSRLFAIDDGNPANDRRTQLFNALLEDANQTIYSRAYRDVQQRSMSLASLLDNALTSQVPFNTSFPSDRLGASLNMITQLINSREQFGRKRQIFYVIMGGFDTHANQAIEHPQLMQSLNNNLAAFNQAMKELGLNDSVTLFTQSEFGRTLSVNGDGTDHGWGGHQFIMGGSVIGQNIYGTMPNLTLNGPDD